MIVLDVFLENVNIGEELLNLDYDISIQYDGRVKGRDIKLGGNAGLVKLTYLNTFEAKHRLKNMGKCLENTRLSIS